MPYIAPTTQWFIISYLDSTSDYLVEWSDELDLTHLVHVEIQPTISLYQHFTSIEYTNLTQKNLADYLERVIEANNQPK